MLFSCNSLNILCYSILAFAKEKRKFPFIIQKKIVRFEKKKIHIFCVRTMLNYLPDYDELKITIYRAYYYICIVLLSRAM